MRKYELRLIPWNAPANLRYIRGRIILRSHMEHEKMNRIARALEDARVLLEEVSLDQELRPVAYQLVLEHLLGEAESAEPSSGGPAALVDDPVERIAHRAQVNPQLLRELYDVDGGVLSLVVGPRRIDGGFAAATRQLTLLVAGGRQAAGFDDWTSLSHIRAMCENYGRLDHANFAATVRSMHDEFSFRGSGEQRTIRLTMAGWERWVTLVRRLAGHE